MITRSWSRKINKVTAALCRFLCRRLSIGKFKLQVSFSLGSFVSDKNIWNALSISLLYLVRVDCRPTSQQIYKRTSSNLIRKGTGCDEYVEDQLNVASKNFAKYLFDDTDGKRYLEDICSMKGWSEKNAILNFFSRHDLTALHTKFHTSQTPPSRFCK